MKNITKKKLTLRAPSSQRVGSSPTEYISRKIVDTIRVRIPEGRGTIMTIINDTTIAVQTSPERRGSSSAVRKKKINK